MHARLLAIDRGHGMIVSPGHYVIDGKFDEHRSRIRTAYGPDSVCRLWRFSFGVVLRFSDGKTGIAQKIARGNCNLRLVFDYLRRTGNSLPKAQR